MCRENRGLLVAMQLDISIYPYLHPTHRCIRWKRDRGAEISRRTGTMADLSGRLRLSRDGLGTARQLQTLGDPGAVMPDTCSCPCTHTYTTMSLHGALSPYTKQSVEYLHCEGGTVVPLEALTAFCFHGVYCPSGASRPHMHPNPAPCAGNYGCGLLNAGHHRRCCFSHPAEVI